MFLYIEMKLHKHYQINTDFLSKIEFVPQKVISPYSRSAYMYKVMKKIYEIRDFSYSNTYNS